MKQAPKKKYSDEEIIAGIRAGGSEQRKFENILYEQNIDLVKRGSKKYSMITEKSKSAFSDAIIAVIKNIINEKFEHRGPLGHYLKKIFRNKCIDELRSEKSYRENMHREGIIEDLLDTMPDKTADIIRALIKKQELSILHEELMKLGKKCYQLLMLWRDRFSDDEIAEKMRYNTAKVVRSTRARCIDKLLNKNSDNSPDHE